MVNMLMSEYNYEQDIEVQREEAFEEGQKLGKSEGVTEGKQFMSRLIQILVEKNRLDDLKKASEEPEYLEKLLREFDLL